ncbi:hypothetical protein CANARDRAFT_5979 [[Candida] arabinofermentans NRRL YB-2248]|uniref:Vacuolar ATPase assembly integral membrane protein VPH2 n=1 Tax=[Candida] arabinofermentans NRRL YB-2248 TaxID=983967 RepID=A0A1E4T710_9ASCO|nr:hypothetical protein CANARDRAFT_5979 [[Candida] arabinofermentans NRRL YB-2248]
MLKFTLTDRIRDKLTHVQIPEDLTSKITTRGWISYEDLITLHKLHQSNIQPDSQNEQLSLLELLKGSSIYKHPPPTAAKTPEFLKMMEQLRLKEQEYEYQKLVKSGNRYGGSRVFKLDAGSNDDDEFETLTPLQQTKQVNHQLTTIFNIFVSVASVGYAVWYWTGTSMRISDAYRVLLSLFFSILVLVAEVVVFGGYLRKVEEAKKTERKKKEIQKVVDTVTFGSKS